MTRCCMSEFTMDRLRENLESLKRAVADKLNIR